MDGRRDVLAALIRLTQDCLDALGKGTPDIGDMIEPRERLFAQLIALDAEQGPLPEALHETLRRLGELNAQLDAAIRGSIGETTERLKGVARGRKGLVGYRDSAGGRGAGTRLGKI
jgi:hypothetical protein